MELDIRLDAHAVACFRHNQLLWIWATVAISILKSTNSRRASLDGQFCTSEVPCRSIEVSNPHLPSSSIAMIFLFLIAQSLGEQKTHSVNRTHSTALVRTRTWSYPWREIGSDRSRRLRFTDPSLQRERRQLMKPALAHTTRQRPAPTALQIPSESHLTQDRR